MFWGVRRNGFSKSGGAGQKCAYQGIEAIVGVRDIVALLLRNGESCTQFGQQPIQQLLAASLRREIILRFVGLPIVDEKLR